MAKKKTVEELEQELEKTKTEAAAIIDDLIENQSTTKTTGNPVIKINGKKYEVTIPRFLFNGKEFDGSKLDEATASELLEIGFAGLSEIK